RSMNAEHDERTLGPKAIPDPAADNPAVVIANRDRDQRRRSRKESTAPIPGSGGLPCESIALSVPESLSRRTLRRTAFLGEQQIWFQTADHPRPVTTPLQASCAEKVVGDDSHFTKLRLANFRSLLKSEILTWKMLFLTWKSPRFRTTR